MLHFLYKLDDVEHKTYLIGTFDQYVKMCHSIGRHVADEYDYGYTDDDGNFYQSEQDDENYGATFWQPGRLHIETIDGFCYWFERIELSKRELRRFFETGQPMQKKDGGLRLISEVWDDEQRFWDEPVKQFTFGIHLKSWLDDGLNGAYVTYTHYAPDEQRARLLFAENDLSHLEDMTYEVRVTVEERPLTGDLVNPESKSDNND